MSSITKTIEMNNLSWADETELSEDNYVSHNIVLTDTLDDLKLYHYSYCDDFSGDEVKRNRGIVRCEDTIVCKTFPYIDEVQTTERDRIERKVCCFEQCKFYKCEEGASIRLFFHKNKWYMTTHRKLNAFNSKWGSHGTKSFGEMFIDALKYTIDSTSLCQKVTYENRDEVFDCFCNTLDRNKNYVFLLRNSQYNRIVCDPPENPTIYFLGSFDKTTHLLTEGNDSGVESCQSLNFESIDDLLKYVDEIDYKKNQGVIVFMPNQTQLKIINSKYMECFKARGNEPSIKFRYIQVRKDVKTVQMLTNLYPEYVESFTRYENILQLVSKKICKSYVDRYIHKKYVSLPQQEYFILQDCYNLYLGTKEYITPEKVLNIINGKTSSFINRLIKQFKQN